MTVIIALEHDDKVYLGADSFLGSDDRRDYIDHPKFFTKDGMTLAFAGGLRSFQVIQHSVKFRKRKKVETEMSYLVNHVALSIREALNNAGQSTIAEKVDTDFIICYQGKVYQLQEDFSVCRSALGYIAIGVGAPYAYGALVALNDSELNPKISPEEKINIALRASAALSPQVVPPFNIIQI